MNTSTPIYTHSLLLPVLGTVTLYSDGLHLVGLTLPGQHYEEVEGSNSVSDATLPIFKETEEWLRIYESGHNPDFMPSLRPCGTPFRETVWQTLLTVPYGSVTTYGAIATAVAEITGKATSARAVGGAVGHNPIPVLIPCHRIVGHNGRLTGYTGGLSTKITLLTLEHIPLRQHPHGKLADSTVSPSLLR